MWRKTDTKTGELFFKPIIVSIDDADKFEQKEIMKKRLPTNDT